MRQKILFSPKTFFKSLVAIITLGSVFALNVRGYLSVLPNSFHAAVDSEFIFNYLLQFSMAVAMSTILGWQFGDIAYLATRLLRSALVRLLPSKEYLVFVSELLTLDILGPTKIFILRCFFTIISFCFLFSGFSILTQIILLIELLIAYFATALYFSHRESAVEPLPFFEWLNTTLDELIAGEWGKIDFLSFLPLGVFFTLLFSHELGEDRANRVLSSQPAVLGPNATEAIAFATSGLGLILAIPQTHKEKETPYEFILLGSSGDILLTSKSKP